ncbi:MAG: zinc ABC transporter substrate-binding protein [Clostridiales bacterium]|nr:zinc ABC transporter substrate-binding protein [Clostridiales bacterium]
MRRFGWFASLLAWAALALCSCAPIVEGNGPEPERIYATFYPIYALSSLALKDIPAVELSCLVAPQDGCLRSYALSDRDAYLLKYAADAVIAGGRGLESFEFSLYALGDGGPAVVTVLNNIELYNQGDSREADEEAGHLVGANPHLYMSAEGAREMVEAIALCMSELDPDYEDRYMENLDAATARLGALQAEMASLAASAVDGRAILMNEALIYLARELNLTVAGQFDRESGESMAGTDLSNCLEALSAMDARVVLIEKQAPKALVDALTGAGYIVTKIDILSTGREDMGADGYFAAQLENARAIGRAFQDAEGSD